MSRRIPTKQVLNGLITIMCLFFARPLLAGGGDPHGEAEKTPSAYTLSLFDPHDLDYDFSHAKDKGTAIETAYRIAVYFTTAKDDYHAADSVLQLAIDLAEASYDNLYLVNAYANYLLVMDSYAYRKKVDYLAYQMGEIENKVNDQVTLWKAKLGKARAGQLAFEPEFAIDYAYQALDRAKSLDDPSKVAESHLVAGDILRVMNENVEAISNFLDALAIAEAEEDMMLKMKCYNRLSNFYNLLKAYHKAIDYKLKELEIAEHASNADSTMIMSLKFDLEVIAFNNRTVNEKQLYKIIKYAEAHREEKLKNFAMIAFRNHLIKQNDQKKLYSFYHETYPEELDKIRQTDTLTYYRLQALFNEYKGNIDSADHYYQAAATQLNGTGNQFRVASHYLRYGEFLERAGFSDRAVPVYKTAYEVASEIDYYEFMLEATSKLESLYAGEQQYQDAYTYGKLNRKLTDSLGALVQKEQLLLVEIENEELIRAQRAQRAAEETRRRNNIQYTLIVILIATAFVVLVLLSGVKVSPALMKMVGFLTFIFFFEFLILLFDTWIHHQTHGEPWKILVFKILLMSFLLPLHHLIEEKVTHYLIHNTVRFPIRKWLARGK